VLGCRIETVWLGGYTCTSALFQLVEHPEPEMAALTVRATNWARCPGLSCTRREAVPSRVAGCWMTDPLANSNEKPGYPIIEQVLGP
jgi:hypothetical protein